MSYGITGRR